ncbi:MAG: hypothetical protein ABI904_17000 [Chloroflexota bacterium]
MSLDFYIQFSSASSYKPHIHSRLVEPRERVDALLPLLYQLIQSENKPEEIQFCPVCGQKMEVSFSKRFQTSTVVDIGVDCKACHIIVLFKSDKIPAWVPLAKPWW